MLTTPFAGAMPRARNMLRHTLGATLALFLATTSFAVVTAPEARADDISPQPAPRPTTPAWQIDVGAAVLVAPRYPGAASERVLPLPDVSVTWADRVFAGFASGFGAKVVKTARFDAGVIARPDFGRRASDTARYLPGLNRVAATAEVGGFGEWRMTRRLALRGELRQAVGGHDGLVGDLSLRWTPVLTPALIVVVAPSLHYASRTTMAAFFATPATGTTAAYQPSGGLERAGVTFIGIHPLSRRLSLVLSVTDDELTGPARHSPVTMAGSTDQLTALAGLRFHL